MTKDTWRIEDGVLSQEPPSQPPHGEITEAARAKARGLRVLKYRLLFIFLLLPSLLVAAILFDWIWDLNLSGHLTRTYVLAIYGGLIAIFCVIGYVIRKKMRREDEEMLSGPVPVEHPRPKPPVTRLRSRD